MSSTDPIERGDVDDCATCGALVYYTDRKYHMNHHLDVETRIEALEMKVDRLYGIVNTKGGTE